jgi:cellobiose phosphorylase
MLSNAYGRFIDGGRAYEITDPRTPMPWVNVICNGRYGLVVSQNGGGFSWLDHCQLNVITRWEMDLARDDHGRFLFVSDLETGQVWSVTPQPCGTRHESYSCVHRPGSTRFVTMAHGIESSWTLAVPPGQTGEVWSVRLTNTTGRARRVRVAAYFEWCCGTAPDVKREFHRLFFTTGWDARRCAVTATKNMWEAGFGTPDDHWNRPWPHAAAMAVGGLDPSRVRAVADKASFLGRYGTPARPEAMTTAGAWKQDTFGRFGDACCALGGDVELAPGASIDLAYALVIEDTASAAAETAARLAQPARAAELVAASERDWEGRLSRSTVKTGAADFDLLNNTWLRYQAISGRLWGRTGYYQQSGAFGFRDQLQDSHVWLAMEPERCGEQIMLHARHQFANGSVYHWWNPITETGHRTACSDDYLWLAFVTASYLRETGDFSILARKARFVDEPGETTLLDHIRRAIDLSLARFSARGLPLIGDMDWNDGLSAVGTATEGESVWLAHFLAGILDDFSRVECSHGDAARAAEYDRRRGVLIERLNDLAWDGAWFRRATDRAGRWLGAKESVAGRIFLNAQTWAILGETTTPERQASAWASAKDHLLTDYGPLLLAPAYTEPDPKVGYITRYAPGARENGGVYMHAATWALAAACKRKDREAAARIWESISPPTRCADADKYWAEPYVVPGNVDGPLSDKPGRAGWTWYTGSAAWLNKVSLEWVLGVRPTWEGLLIDPCPPAALGQVEVARRWRGRDVVVRFDARTYEAGRTPRVRLGGRVLVGGVVREGDVPPGGRAEVEVDWVAGTGVAEAKPAAATAKGGRS